MSTAHRSRFFLSQVESSAGPIHDQMLALIRDVEHAWHGGVRQRATKQLTDQAAVIRRLFNDLSELRPTDETASEAASASVATLADFVVQISMPKQSVTMPVTDLGRTGSVMWPRAALKVAEKNAGRMLLSERSNQLATLLLRALLSATLPGTRGQPPLAPPGFAHSLCDAVTLWVCNPWGFPADELNRPLLDIAALMEASSPDPATAARTRLALAGPALIGLVFIRLCLEAAAKLTGPVTQTPHQPPWSPSNEP